MKRHTGPIIAFLFCWLIFGYDLSAQDLRGSRSGNAKYNNKRSSSGYLKRNKTDVFPLERIYRLGGWSFAPGLTYMWPGNTTDKTEIINDSSFSHLANPNGKMGLYLELSRFHSFARPGIFHYVDFGLAYKQLRGGEKQSLSAKDQLNNTFLESESEAAFRDQLLSFHFNATNHYHFNRYGFINNSIGLNYDLNIGTDRTALSPFPGRTQAFPVRPMLQLHYKLGIGWKASQRVLIIPSIETPILSIEPFDSGKSRLTYFSSKYRPLLFSIRIMLLRLDPEQCNVPSYDGPANFE